MRQTFFKDIAEELGISRRTVFRVMNGEKNVSAPTRKKTLALLKKNGYVVNAQKRREVLLIDTRESGLFDCIIRNLLLEHLSQDDFEILLTDSSYRKNEFQEACAKADIGIFIHIPGDEFLEQVHEINPDLFRISLFGNAEKTEILISTDNTGGGTLAADYLLGTKKKKRVLVINMFYHHDFVERAKAFAGQQFWRYPKSEVIPGMLVPPEDELPALLSRYLLPQRTIDAIFVPGGFTTVRIIEFCVQHNIRIPEDISILGYDNPRYILNRDFSRMRGWVEPDYIAFDPEKVVDWVLYYLKNRPIFQYNSRTICLLPVKLYINGSVK